MYVFILEKAVALGKESATIKVKTMLFFLRRNSRITENMLNRCSMNQTILPFFYLDANVPQTQRTDRKRTKKPFTVS